MSLFKDIDLEWSGKNYTVESDRVMLLIASIENTITMLELNKHRTEGTYPMAKVSMAYADALNYAGAKVTAEDTYSAWFNGGENKNAMVSAIDGLLAMMIPPVAVAEAQQAHEAEAGKQGAGTSS